MQKETLFGKLKIANPNMTKLQFMQTSESWSFGVAIIVYCCFLNFKFLKIDLKLKPLSI